MTEKDSPAAKSSGFEPQMITAIAAVITASDTKVTWLGRICVRARAVTITAATGRAR